MAVGMEPLQVADPMAGAVVLKDMTNKVQAKNNKNKTLMVEHED
jgi:hypothetical protein